MRPPLPPLGVLALAASCAALASCAAPPAPPRVARWLVARPVPVVDPGAPPDEVRWAIERLLARGLTDEDSTGRIVPALARTMSVSEDGRTWTFTLRAGLRFAGGEPLVSGDVRNALLEGLGRRDHSTMRWLLRAIEGVPSIRPGRPLPALGILAPDDSTLVLRLARPDSLLPAALALPGVSAPWRIDTATAGWSGLRGVGPYRVVPQQGERALVLVPGDPGPLPVRAGFDTLRIRFATGARVRAALRRGAVDLAWPLPLADPLREDVLDGYHRAATAPAAVRPARRLELVLRADVAPTAKLAARKVLALSLNRADLLRLLGEGAGPFQGFWPGAPAFDFPALDEDERLAWLASGRLGRSFHTSLAWDPGEVDESVARRLQSQWARADLSVDLRPLRGARIAAERLEGRAQILLVISQGLLEDPATDLAMMVSQWREPPVGRYRSGWRTGSFRAWLTPGRSAPDLEAAQHAIEEDSVVLPLGSLGWSWIARDGGPAVPFHPRFGPDFTIGGMAGHP